MNKKFVNIIIVGLFLALAIFSYNPFVLFMAGAVIRAETKSDDGYWVRYIKQRIERNKNFMALFIGSPGSGKSYGCMSLALKLDPQFSIDRVIFNPKHLIEKFNDPDFKIYPGMVFVLEELQTSQNSRSWQSVNNKLFNYFLSTWRFKRCVLLVNLPTTNMLDSHSRGLFHAEFEAQRILVKKQKLRVRPQIIQTNPKSSKTYFKYLRIKKGGTIMPVKKLLLSKPPKHICELYEEKKEKFTRELYGSLVHQLNIIEAKERGDKPLTEKQKEVIELMDEFEGDKDTVADKLGLTRRTLDFHLVQAKKKGHMPKIYAEKEGKL